MATPLVLTWFANRLTLRFLRLSMRTIENWLRQAPPRLLSLLWNTTASTRWPVQISANRDVGLCVSMAPTTDSRGATFDLLVKFMHRCLVRGLTVAKNPFTGGTVLTLLLGVRPLPV